MAGIFVESRNGIPTPFYTAFQNVKTPMAWRPQRPEGPWPLETEAASNSSWRLGHQPGRLETWGHQGANPMPCWKTTVLHDSRWGVF